MNDPSVILGVPLMDRDHAVLEDLLASAASTDDAGLRDLLEQVEAETRAHFQREESLMLEQALSVLPCHMAQHDLFLDKFQQGREALSRGDTRELRRFMTDVLPALLSHHINSADRVTAGLLMAMPDAACMFTART